MLWFYFDVFEGFRLGSRIDPEGDLGSMTSGTCVAPYRGSSWSPAARAKYLRDGARWLIQ